MYQAKAVFQNLGYHYLQVNNPVGKYPVRDSTNFSEGTEKEVSKKEQFEEQTTKSQTTNSFL